MNRSLITLISLLSIGTLGFADEAKPAPDNAAALEQIQIKLDHTAQRMNQPTNQGSSVVGLRGSKQEPLSKQLYWKGKSDAAPVTPDEVKALRSALAQAKAGKKEVAATALQSFITTYPKSGLVPDAKDALALVSPSKP